MGVKDIRPSDRPYFYFFLGFWFPFVHEIRIDQDLGLLNGGLLAMQVIIFVN
jgi:hypothetical protein